MSQFDTEHLDTMVCPHCGSEKDAPWEYGPDSGEASCDYCNETYHYERNIAITYTTTLKGLQ